MTADYEYNNLPEALEGEALPEEFFADAQNAFIQASNSGLAVALEAKAFHAFDRKGYLDTNSFVGFQNPSYRSNTDDVILQLTIRIPNPATIRGESLSDVSALEGKAAEYRVKAQREKLEAELAQAESVAAKAEETARAAREKLEALRKQ